MSGRGVTLPTPPGRLVARIAAFTLVETIVALSIVATLCLAAIEFTITTTKAASLRQAPIEREARARALFLQIEDAILCFETVVNDDPPRIAATSESVSLRTRTLRSGACLQRYSFDRSRNAVVLEETPFQSRAGKVQWGDRRESIVATDVSDFTVLWEPRSRRLDVSLFPMDGRGDDGMRRRWVIP